MLSEHFMGRGVGEEEGQMCFPDGIALTSKNSVFVCDCMNHRVQELGCEEGSVIQTLGRKGEGEGEFCWPKGVAVGERGEVYVCDGNYDNNSDHRIQVFW